ncbi:nudC domain-containing protein 3-like [Liolophura sinensis]|uniref:nudC domain-containing protein 3-like n=1 Tax=Liolophura sinensis TaxID=3198878 RepID=UPI003158E76F
MAERMDQEKYDPALLGILQNEGQISTFLDVVLGFLYRRTDFFVLMKTKTDKMGFPPGVAAKLLLTAYKKYEDMAKKAEEERAQKLLEEQMKDDVNMAPPAVEIIEVDSEPVSQGCSVTEVVEPDNAQPTPVVSSKRQPPPNDPPANNSTDDGDRKVYQADSECYNGAVRDTYSWSQTIADCDIRVKVPKTVKKGGCVKVNIKKKYLSVAYKDSHSEWVQAMDGPLTWDIKVEEAIWSLVPGEHIHINLEKVQERWWDAVLENEPKINVRQIDASRPYTDLDEESQAKISEMMYNEQQKRLGLPQSHEKNTHEMLKKAWNAKGSPFAGQPFDPSKISVDPSGMVNINS